MPVKIMESSPIAPRDRERKRAEVHVGSRITARKMRLCGSMARKAFRIGRREALLNVAERFPNRYVPNTSYVSHCRPSATADPLLRSEAVYSACEILITNQRAERLVQFVITPTIKASL